MGALKSALHWLDQNAEKTIIVVAYGAMTAIIFVEVIRRYTIAQQAPWSTTIPVYLFLWIAWIGCAYNVRQRSHLRFEEFRRRLPRNLQFGTLILDAILWLTMASVVMWYAIEYVQLLHMNFAIVPGTDDIMQWWFYLATPIGWGILIIRVIQNFIEDLDDFRNGRELRMTVAITSD